MENVLVTGGAGFIGSNFVRFLLNNDQEIKIINLDKLTYAGSLENLKDIPSPNRHFFVPGDVCDQFLVEDLIQKNRIDTVVHFAAETHVDRSIHGPEQFMQTNVMGTFALLEACRQVWLEEKTFPREQVRFHHVSTDEVYGSLGIHDAAFTETSPYAPNSPYAASKAASDHLVRSYYHTFGLPITITNCSNNYGPYQFPEKLIPLIILNALNGEKLPIYGDGMQIRDWLYVDDHCEAIWKVLKSNFIGETFNLGGNNQPANIDIVKQICDILDNCRNTSEFVPHKDLILYVKDRPGHDRRYAMDTSKIKMKLGWQPRESMASGLLKTVGWYLANDEWLRSVRQQQEFQEWKIQNYDDRGEAKL
jgi:dTDP-glucose 4,6-dehydratase